MDFTEAVNKFVINLLMPGSKSLISLKQLQMEYEEYFSIQKGTSESRFREKCIKKMLDRIASRLIINEIDLKEYNQKDFSYSEMENIIVKDLDIFNPNFKRKPSKVDEKEKEDKNKEEKSPVRDQKAEQNTKEKEEPVVKDTIEYIMDGREYIELEGLTDLLSPYLQKQKYCMEVLYRLKKHMRNRECTLLDSFKVYKDPAKYKNSELHVDEYYKVLESINFDISEQNLYKCLDCFEFSSKDRIDYTKFCEEVQNAKNPAAKGLRNIRKFKTMEAIYQYLANQCMIYFPLGHLLKDHDYEDNGFIKMENLEIILRKGASEMTEGDLHFFMNNLTNQDGEVDSQKLISDINYYVKDRDKRQKLETHIPSKILNPIGISDIDQKEAEFEMMKDRRASKTKYDQIQNFDQKANEEAAKLDKLNEEIARKINNYNVDVNKFCSEKDKDNNGLMDELDFKDLIKRDINFAIRGDEMEMLWDFYGKNCRRGFVDYKLWIDDVVLAQKRREERAKLNDEKPKDAKNAEDPISVRPSPNLPSDNRYSMKNTVVGRYPESRKLEKRKVKVSETTLQDLIKATYLRDVFIEDYFIRCGKGRNYIVSQNSLKDAFASLGIKMNSKGIDEIYNAFIINDKELTAELIDISVEDSSKRGIEEIQKSILEFINRGIKNQTEIRPKEMFIKHDNDSNGSVTFNAFENIVRSYVPKIKSMDALFLAKRYCEKDDKVSYFKMLDEIDLLDRGINPLITWAESLAETIVKAVTAKPTDFETLFKRFATHKSYISEDEFVKAMQDIGVDNEFKVSKIKKFYYFIDDDKSQKVEFREMESIIKTQCTKTTQKLIDEILDSIKSQMDHK